MNILLVDDNKSILKSISEFIESLGHTVTSKEDGKQALVELESNTTIQMVLSDIQMPNMSGLELLTNLGQRGLLDKIIVVLFTGHGDVKGAVEAMRKGAYDYLLKPINVGELAEIIKRAAEYLSLKIENEQLNSNFQNQVDWATRDVQAQLSAVKKAYSSKMGLGEIGVFSKSLEKVLVTAEKLHQNPDIPVLIEGETGTGKELIARVIHYGDGETIDPFVDLNCAAMSAGLFESELFGYEAGAFTGGNPKGQKGKIELAESGSLFMDEITEMPFEHQAKLLRVIQEREYYKVGGLKKMQAHCRFISATNKKVNEQIKSGVFREDLFFRMSIGHLVIPPLRDRREEILPLADLFLKELQKKKKTSTQHISTDAQRSLVNYDWPGNVRQLRGTIEKIAIFYDKPVIDETMIESVLTGQSTQIMEEKSPYLSSKEFILPEGHFLLKKFTDDIIKAALEKFDDNKTQTANYLGISLRVLQTYIKNFTS